MTTYSLSALPTRFWAKVNTVPSGCWIWTAAIDSTGYGRFAWEGRPQVAHRVAYKVLVGPIPDGLVLDHLCRNRPCVNPEHLEPVTNTENILRGIGPSAMHSVKTHCPQGHPYDDTNTYDYRGMRYCQTCKRAHAQAAHARVAVELANDPTDVRHGTLSGYTSYRCRCDLCRAANRNYKREYRARAG